MKFRVVEDCRALWPVQALCSVPGVSTAGYYAWRTRPDSKRVVENRALLSDIRQVHANSGGRYGSPRVHATLRAYGRKAGLGRVERLMRRHGVRGLVAPRRRVQTTDSRHAFPIAPNLLDRKFRSYVANATGQGSLVLQARIWQEVYRSNREIS
jgi:transposase InsO family protein